MDFLVVKNRRLYQKKYLNSLLKMISNSKFFKAQNFVFNLKNRS